MRRGKSAPGAPSRRRRPESCGGAVRAAGSVRSPAAVRVLAPWPGRGTLGTWGPVACPHGAEAPEEGDWSPLNAETTVQSRVQ